MTPLSVSIANGALGEPRCTSTCCRAAPTSPSSTPSCVAPTRCGGSRTTRCNIAKAGRRRGASGTELALGTNLLDFSVRASGLRPTKVAVNGWDAQAQSDITDARATRRRSTATSTFADVYTGSKGGMGVERHADRRRRQSQRQRRGAGAGQLAGHGLALGRSRRARHRHRQLEDRAGHQGARDRRRAVQRHVHRQRGRAHLQPHRVLHQVRRRPGAPGQAGRHTRRRRA